MAWSPIGTFSWGSGSQEPVKNRPVDVDTRGMTTKPLLLLDIDGVVNNLEAVMRLRPLKEDAEARAEQLGVDLVWSHGFWFAIPHEMPALVQELTSRFETWWCTRWREHANDEIAKHLGVGPFPVVDDGADSFGGAWKIEAARPLIMEAIAAGREVVWIEDFKGRIPDIRGVTYVDTGERGFLSWSDIPVDSVA